MMDINHWKNYPLLADTYRLCEIADFQFDTAANAHRRAQTQKPHKLHYNRTILHLALDRMNDRLIVTRLNS